MGLVCGCTNKAKEEQIEKQILELDNKIKPLDEELTKYNKDLEDSLIIDIRFGTELEKIYPYFQSGIIFQNSESITETNKWVDNLVTFVDKEYKPQTSEGQLYKERMKNYISEHFTWYENSYKKGNILITEAPKRNELSKELTDKINSLKDQISKLENEKESLNKQLKN